MQGAYHYHGLSSCVTAKVDAAGKASHVIGFALDGFPIYGDRDIKGKQLTAKNLDQCNGIYSATPEFPKGIYHYVLLGTADVRSSIACFHGVVDSSQIQAMPNMGGPMPDLAAAAKKHGVRQAVMLRLTPGIEAHTHEKISTAHEDVKFGFSIASGSAWAAVEAVATHPELELLGVHCHIGSQIFGSEAHEIATDRLIGFMAKYRDAYGKELPELDLGGGFGIAYIDGDVTVEPSDVLPQIHAAVKKACAQHNLAIPLVSLEPGRNIVGPTMFTLYEVGTVKDVVVDGGKVRKYVSVDGGMSDNARTALYDAEYTAVIAQRNSTAPLALTRLVGKHCETGDIIINEIQLPSDIAPGDLVATPATGAYGRSMASNYNHVPRPPVVAVKDGKARVIVRRENEADLLSLDVKE